VKFIEPNGMIWWLLREGGSNASVKNSVIDSQKNLAEMEQLIETDKLRDIFYYVSQAPVTEIVIERFGDNDNPYASITRNRYGALVLNAPNVFFADIDVKILSPKVSKEPDMKYANSIANMPDSIRNSMFSMISNMRRANPTPEEEDELERTLSKLKTGEDYWNQMYKNYVEERDREQRKALNTIAEFSNNNPLLSFRVYETAAGYRLIMTSRTVSATSVESSQWLESLNSDKLYNRLCEQQQCYRARLTPKPWRLPDFKSPKYYLKAKDSDEYELVAWLNEYLEKSKSYAVCQLVASYGDGVTTSEAELVVKIHDEYVFNEESPELA